ncbi:MAG: DNA methyltransferase [Candidatus Nitrosopumilus sp. bin_32a]
MNVKNPPKKIPIAQKHPMHYLMHKYWARKPHNVVHDYIDYFTKEGDVVMDPFSGSGVTVIESVKFRRKGISVDINPISTHIIEGTLIPILTIDFDDAIEKIQQKIEPLLETNYSFCCIHCDTKSRINYTAWSQVITCDSCSTKFPVIEAEKSSRGYYCIKCNHLNKSKYSINREEIPYEIKYDCTKCKKSIIHKVDANQIKIIQKIQNKNSDRDLTGDLMFNPRTLVEKNMRVSDLFTKRNLIILNKIKNEIEKIQNKNLKKIMYFVFTSSVAQSSRLIAYRKGLTTGGPAWTISGFWIPAVNMEINPLKNFINKSKKIKSGKRILSEKIDEIGVSEFKIVKNQKNLMKNTVLNFNKSINSITDKDIDSNSVDYIFTDPPYGDSVPYLEYSALWASWLEKKLDYEKEIIISDSPDRKKNLENYDDLISKAFQNCFRILKEGSWMSITFHNRFLETWKVLLESIENAGFSYVSANFLIPAVIPAKAQLSKGSLEGDLVMHYRKIKGKKSKKIKDNDIESKIVKQVNEVLSFMGGKARVSQIWNSIIFLLLENQYGEIPYEKIKPILISKFIEKNGFVQNGMKLKKQSTFSDLVKKISKNKKYDDEHKLIAKIYEEIPVRLAPSISEVKEKIKESTVESNPSLEKFF